MIWLFKFPVGAQAQKALLSAILFSITLALILFPWIHLPQTGRKPSLLIGTDPDSALGAGHKGSQNANAQDLAALGINDLNIKKTQGPIRNATLGVRCLSKHLV